MKEEKPVHRHLPQLCTWGKAGVSEAMHKALEQQQGYREELHKALRKLGTALSAQAGSSDPKHPSNQSQTGIS